MNYADFIAELKPLVDEARSLFNDEQTHHSGRFRKWRHRLATTIDSIEQLGYSIDCNVASRVFDVMSYGSVSKLDRLEIYNRELQDTINELEIIIERFDKYGDPLVAKPKTKPPSISNKDESPHVQVARIGARQAITVALITAIAAIVGTVLSQPIWQRSASSAPQWYISITKVELLTRGMANEPSPPVRIIPIVNNQAYSYPSRALWIRTEDSSPGEDFPLPQFSDRVAVRFDALIRRGETFGQLTSQEVQSYSLQQLPVKGVYDLLAVDEQIIKGGSNTTKVRVTYEIKPR
jgi:hypothetical protein